MTARKALELARRFRATDTASLILAVSHVASELRGRAGRMSAADREALDRLASTLHAALIARPEEVYLERYAESLDAAKGGGA